MIVPISLFLTGMSITQIKFLHKLLTNESFNARYDSIWHLHAAESMVFIESNLGRYLQSIPVNLLLKLG